jgi:hypothetical protein
MHARMRSEMMQWLAIAACLGLAISASYAAWLRVRIGLMRSRHRLDVEGLNRIIDSDFNKKLAIEVARKRWPDTFQN